MATAAAISLTRSPLLITPRACSPRRLVHVPVLRAASPQRGGGRVVRRSLTVSEAAGPSSGPAPDAGAPAWDALGGVSVLAAGTGDAVALTDLWDPTEGVAVVALLRHFGCFCCWELASVLKDSMAKFDSAGAKLIAIGVGTPEKARILADRLPFPLDSLYADPERKAYNVLGLYHGLGRTFFNPASAKIYSRLEYIKQATKNYTLEGTPADLTGVLQQGGMFVFRGKELLYSWRDQGTGDHAPLDDVLSACGKGYNLLGLYFGVDHTFFNPASVKVFSRFDSLKEAVKNYTIEATPDDRAGVLQQGGMFVFKGKELLYAWKDECTGDHAPLDDVLDICCKVPVT